MLKTGDKMPSFEVRDQDGNVVKSEDGILQRIIENVDTKHAAEQILDNQ